MADQTPHELQERDRTLLRVWVQNNMSRGKTAKALYIAPTSLDYRLRCILRDTGLNPRNFHDLQKLLEGVEAHENRTDGAGEI